MNADIEYIRRHPGRYAIPYSAVLPVHHAHVMLEVDADGTIYQLTQQDQRDGVLSPDGFHPNVRAYVVSDSGKTFVRVPAVVGGETP